MRLRETISAPLNDYCNQLEPNHLLGAFFECPPQNFSVHILENKLPAFSTVFDLTTTMDHDERVRLKKIPFYRIWSALLHYKTLFVGTTVSEFAPLPKNMDSEKLALSLVQQAKDRFPLVIVKDLPQLSPLTNDEDDRINQTFLDALLKQGFIVVEGQALAFVPVDYTSIDDYLACFSKVRRKDFRRKLRMMNELKIDVLCAGDPAFFDDKQLQQFYALYKQVYTQSEIHFDLLSFEFFTKLLQSNDETLRVMIYKNNEGQLIGYNICFVVKDMLVDKYIGFDYPAATHYNLYFISWFYNLEYARTQGLKYYIAGWTDPKIKAYLGAQFAFTKHVVFIRNPILRYILKRFRHRFESDAQWQNDTLKNAVCHE